MNLNWNLIQDDVQNLVDDSARTRHLLKLIRLAAIKPVPDGFLVYLTMENRLTLQMAERHVLPQLRRVIESRLGSAVQFNFEFHSTQESFDIITAESDEPTAHPATLIPSTAYVFKHKHTLNPVYDFAHFCVTQENAFAQSATAHFASSENTEIPVMTITGPSGTGKTHLLHAAGWAFLARQSGLKVKVVSGDDLITDFQTAIVKRSMGDFRLKYRTNTDILLVDDIHCLEKAKATQTELFNLINDFISAGKKIIFTCDRAIQKIEGFDERLKSRLLGSFNLELEYPSVQSKLQILNYKLQHEGLVLPVSIIDRVLHSCGPCIRSVEGALHRLKMLLKTTGDLETYALDKMFPVPTTKQVEALSIESLLLRVCEDHKLTLSDIKGPSRKRPVVAARRACAHALRNELGKTIAQIGRVLQRDHSSVIGLLKN